MVLYLFVEAFWFILPAYAANGMAPLFKGTHPIDGGRKFRGKEIFGPGKTWEGLFFGSLIAMFIGFIQMAALPGLPFNISPVPLFIVGMTPLIGLFIGLGAMLGDLLGSFIKRRINLSRGRPAPVLDQTDFLFGAFLLPLLLLTPIKWQWFLLMFILTPLFHLLANAVGYVLKLNDSWY
jgi:CDP-2,3-bis-(O-geranylgeranyl)-sn-glycerol synthase